METVFITYIFFHEVHTIKKGKKKMMTMAKKKNLNFHIWKFSILCNDVSK